MPLTSLIPALILNWGVLSVHVCKTLWHLLDAPSMLTESEMLLLASHRTLLSRARRFCRFFHLPRVGAEDTALTPLLRLQGSPEESPSSSLSRVNLIPVLTEYK